MRPFPPADALQFFVGDTIAQVRLDPFGLQFSFESARLLHAELAVEQCEPDGTVWPYDCQADQRPPLVLHRLLGLPIVALEREELRLTFRFNDCSSLAILSALNGYESGAISAPELGYAMF